MLAELHITYSTGGNIFFGEYLGFLIATLITGFLADRFGLKSVILLAGLFLGIGVSGYSIFMAGGGFKGGTAYGETDEFGANAIVDPVSVHDIHATILHQMGLDHERLTFRHGGRDARLTDVHGHVVKRLVT